MKILFLEIDTERTWGLTSVGPGYIGSYLRTRGHEAALLRVLPDHKIKEILGRIEREAPDILGFSITTNQWQRAAYVAGEIRKNMDTPVIAGGIHPTFAPLSVLESDGFDYVCLGEGEEATYELLSCLEKGDGIYAGQIANIWVKGSGRPEMRPPFEPIGEIPFVARDLIDEKHGVIHMMTQRGCPFPCTFCAAGAIVDLYKNTAYIRRRTVDNVLQELRQIQQQKPLNYVIFLDDTFTINRAWVKEFCRLYGREIGTGFSINARVETVNRDMIESLTDAGCRHIVYGVESGSLRVRREILNRPLEDRRIMKAFSWTKQANIMVTANYMIGLPGETPEDIDQTLSLNGELEPDDFECFVFYPYPGTHLFQTCRLKGFLPENWLKLLSNNRQSILNMPDLTKDDIEHYYNIFTKVRENAYTNRYGRALE
ncbi:B12-binding domain-containing radical SAM protein [Thermodesulfobacteriota bacterium]